VWGVPREWPRLTIRSIYSLTKQTNYYPLEAACMGALKSFGGHRSAALEVHKGQFPMALKLVVARYQSSGEHVWCTQDNTGAC
jgi:hypothetical protein